MTTKTHALKPGDTFYALDTITVQYSENHSAVVPRGQTVVVTADMLTSSLDRNGVSWLDMVDDPAAQVAKWGNQRFARGDAPEDVVWHNGGDAASVGLARTLALEEARKVSDPAERAERIAATNQKFGIAPTSFVVATYSGDADNSFSPGESS